MPIYNLWFGVILHHPEKALSVRKEAGSLDSYELKPFGIRVDRLVGELAFPKAHSKKSISHIFHRFYRQGGTLSLSFQAIISIVNSEGEKKSEERKEEKK